jgi:WD40 repeat protein
MSTNFHSVPRVFISYARSDGEQFASNLRARLEAKGIPLWQDRTGMEGGKDWLQQIKDALDVVEFMVPVMTPAAMQSEMVRKEWRYARQQGVCVYPVKGAPDLDFNRIPHWMRSVHFYDLKYEWSKFVNDLNKSCQQAHVPFMAEELPADYVARPQEFKALIEKLLDQQREEPVAITAALRGAGGYGKTTMARALCHDERIQQAFDDGILWVTLGEHPGNLVGKVEDLIETLSGKRPDFTGIDAAGTRLAELLADRDILLVLDDIWDAIHLKPFLQGGKRCARLVTTRNENVLPADAQRIQVDAMQQQEAMQLLTSGLSSTPLRVDDTKALEALATRLGKWPLLLKLANGVLRERIRKGQLLPDAMAYINAALDKRGMTAFDDKNAQDRSLAVAKTLSVSLDMLSTDEKARYNELAVFAEDVDIPLVTLQRLWGVTGGLDDLDTEELCERLYRFSLLLNFDLMTRTIRLHDVVRAYLRSIVGGQGLSILHRQLLAAYGLQRWADLPRDEPYMWDHLADHLIGANRVEELIATVKDLRYVARKALLRSVYSCQTDLIVAAQVAPNDVPLHLLTRNILNMSHLLKQCETFNEIASVLCSRLRHLEGLSELCHAFEQKLPRPHFSPWHTLPDLPHPALICTLQGHTDFVYGCAVSPDGSFIVSASYDHTLKIWDALTGRERLTLRGHTGKVNTCAVSPDGSYIVSASYDQTLKIWDAHTGQERLTLRGHTYGVLWCAVSPQGDWIVSTSSDSLRKWDAQTGQALLALQEDGPYGPCRISPNGDFIVAGTRRNPDEFKVWEAHTGVERFTRPGGFCVISPDSSYIVSRWGEVWDAHTGVLRFTLPGDRCAVSPDGSYIVSVNIGSVTDDGTLTIWDAHTGMERLSLRGHIKEFESSGVSPDGKSIVTVSNLDTLQVWNAQTGQLRGTLTGQTSPVNTYIVSPKGDFIVSAFYRTLNVWAMSRVEEHSFLQGHTSRVTGCALSPSGDYVVSSAYDGTLKIWDTQTGQERMTLKGLTKWVECCAVSPLGDFIVSGSRDFSVTNDQTVEVWDAKTGNRRFILRGHEAPVNRCAVSPQGDYIVSASNDKTLKVWDAQTGVERFTLRGHRGSVSYCAVAPKGDYIVSSSEDGTLIVWYMGQTITSRTLHGHTAWVTSCKVSPDGNFIVSTSMDKTIKVWDAYTGAELLSLLHGPEIWLYSCAINPAGTLIISTSEDGALKLWDVQSGKHLTTFFVDGALIDCTFHPDGEHIIAAGTRGLYFLRLVQ